MQGIIGKIQGRPDRQRQRQLPPSIEPLEKPSSDHLASLWERRWRPNAVLCVVHDEKVLLCYDRRFKLWQFPQGGVEPGEDIEEAVAWELAEELGETFAKRCSSFSYLFSDKLRFSRPRKIKLNPNLFPDGQIKIVGKVYYFYRILAETDALEVGETEFDELRWCTHQEALELTKEIYQPGKRGMTEKALNVLFTASKSSADLE